METVADPVEVLCVVLLSSSSSRAALLPICTWLEVVETNCPS